MSFRPTSFEGKLSAEFASIRLAAARNVWRPGISNDSRRPCKQRERGDMGKVMKRAQELAVGRADGKLLSAAVMKRLL